MKTILGIDFGTTTTTVAMTTVESRFDPELIEIDGLRTVETVIRYDSKGEFVEQLGQDAKKESYLYPDRTFFEFKPQIGSEIQYKIESVNKTFSADDLCMQFLKTVREKIENQQFNGSPLNEMDLLCVIGYPSEWSGTKKSLIVKMAGEAGFPNIIGCEEPLGVLYYHHYKGDLSVDNAQTVIVYDFGGGTTDVAIVRTKKDSKPEVIGFGGNDFGGQKFDEELIKYLSDKIILSMGLSELSSADIAQIKNYARVLKEKLSNAIATNSQKVEITIPVLEATKSSYRIVLEKDEFEQECKNLIAKFEEPIDLALQLSGLNREDINISILAGGSGRFYYARDKIRDSFPKDIEIQSPNPQEVIAKGLAIFGCVREIGNSACDHEHKNNSDENHQETFQSTDTSDSYNKKEDPYKEKKEVQEHSKKKKLYIGLIIVIAVLGFFFVFNGNDEIQQKTNSTIEQTVTHKEQIIEQNRDIEVLKKMVESFSKADAAQSDDNYSSFMAAKADAMQISMEDTKEDLKSLREDLFEYFSKGDALEQKYGFISQHNRLNAFEWSYNSDTLDQEAIDDNSNKRAFFHNSYRFMYYANFTAAELNIEKPFSEISKYYFKLKRITLQEETFKDADGMFNKPDPHIYGTYLFSDSENEAYPVFYYGGRDNSYGVSINDDYVAFIPKEHIFCIAVYDHDEFWGELLDYIVLPQSDISGLTSDKGTRFSIDIEYFEY